MLQPAIKDENLRLLLAPGHDDYLIARIRERFVANLVIAAVFIGVPFACLVGTMLTGGLDIESTLSQQMAEIPYTVTMLLVVASPFAAMIIGRNLWVARTFIRYYHEHADFLEKYHRETDPERLRAERYHVGLQVFSGLSILLILFLFLFTLALFRNVEKSTEKTGFPAETDQVVCVSAGFGNAEAKKEAAVRGLTEDRCRKILH